MWNIRSPIGDQSVHNISARAWELAESQHGVVSRAQLIELGLSPKAIKHRLDTGRLHRVRTGIYAVGRPGLPQPGLWMAAVLTCGPGAMLSHLSAAALWGIRKQRGGRPGRTIDVTVPAHVRRRRVGIRLHRPRRIAAEDLSRCDGIPVTSPARTLIDLATLLRPKPLEAAVNQADKLSLIDPDGLRAVVDRRTGARGVAALRKLLDRRTFRLTDSELERRFLPLARKAGLPLPETGCIVNGFKVDFHWRDRVLVVETDGLRYHRTPSQQTRDRERDQAHAAAGLTSLRFTHAQVRFQPAQVAATLSAVARRLGEA